MFPCSKELRISILSMHHVYIKVKVEGGSKQQINSLSAH